VSEFVQWGAEAAEAAAAQNAADELDYAEEQYNRAAPADEEHRMAAIWVCEDCGWRWPLPSPPPEGAECDNCGGELVAADA
jgi:hypothetical protein